MKRITAIAVVFGLAAAPAFAEPVQMSEAQLDQVVAGQGLVDVSVSLSDTANPSVTVSNPGGVTVNPQINPNANAPVTVSVLSLGGLR